MGGSILAWQKFYFEQRQLWQLSWNKIKFPLLSQVPGLRGRYWAPERHPRNGPVVPGALSELPAKPRLHAEKVHMPVSRKRCYARISQIIIIIIFWKKNQIQYFTLAFQWRLRGHRSPERHRGHGRVVPEEVPEVPKQVHLSEGGLQVARNKISLAKNMWQFEHWLFF